MFGPEEMMGGDFPWGLTSKISAQISGNKRHNKQQRQGLVIFFGRDKTGYGKPSSEMLNKNEI